MSLSDGKITEYTRLNPVIASKHPSKSPANAREYFQAAVAYYNDISYNEVKL
jgi:hypothetical protein